MQPLLTRTELARRADMDDRAVASRIKTLAIQPTAVLGNGRALYSADVVQQLKVRVAPAHATA